MKSRSLKSLNRLILMAQLLTRSTCSRIQKFVPVQYTALQHRLAVNIKLLCQSHSRAHYVVKITKLHTKTLHHKSLANSVIFPEHDLHYILLSQTSQIICILLISYIKITTISFKTFLTSGDRDDTS